MHSFAPWVPARRADPPAPRGASDPSRLRMLTAILLLAVMALLAAASVQASRPWLPADRPAEHPRVGSSTADPC